MVYNIRWNVIQAICVLHRPVNFNYVVNRINKRAFTLGIM